VDSGKKYRETNQRRVILEKLSKVTSHPSADEVYQAVRRELPRISLGTVYRNLEVLVKMGKIQRLVSGASQMRFDANTQQHCHVRCLRCERIDDVHCDELNEKLLPLDEMKGLLSKRTGFEIKGYSVEVLGLCPRCRRKGNTH